MAPPLDEDENMVVPPQDLNDGIEPMEGHGESVATVENQPVDDHIGKFTWTLTNFGKLSVRKHYSDPFVVGGYKWSCWCPCAGEFCYFQEGITWINFLYI